jgi:hypothetical protein
MTYRSYNFEFLLVFDQQLFWGSPACSAKVRQGWTKVLIASNFCVGANREDRIHSKSLHSSSTNDWSRAPYQWEHLDICTVHVLFCAGNLFISMLLRNFLLYVIPRDTHLSWRNSSPITSADELAVSRSCYSFSLLLAMITRSSAYARLISPHWSAL